VAIGIGPANIEQKYRQQKYCQQKYGGQRIRRSRPLISYNSVSEGENAGMAQ
jgi:hypothetical protein